MKERDVRDYFLQEVERVDGVAKKTDPPPKGFPDWVVLLPRGYVAFAELKRPERGILADAQRYWAHIIHRKGGRYFLISNKTDVDVFLIGYQNWLREEERREKESR